MQRRTKHLLLFSLSLAMSLQTAAYVFASDDDAQDQPPRQPLSLDELLGLPQDSEESARSAEEAAQREAEEALQRRLEHGRQLAGHFAQAIEQMRLSADLLDAHFDPGIGTQRIQEDIIAKLTHLIDEASQMPTPSSASGQQGERTPDPQRDPGMQESQQQAGQPEQRSGEPTEGTPPPMQQEDVHTTIEEMREEWGALPERIREMLLQGRQEKFSSLYEQLTREYYRRLASDD